METHKHQYDKLWREGETPQQFILNIKSIFENILSYNFTMCVAIS